MPTNKHASFRYRALNQCFTNRGHRKWTLDELVREVSRYLQDAFGADLTVGQRTIQGDINVMRSPRPRGFSAPIVCRRGLYYYTDPNFSIEKIPLGQEEVNLLQEAVVLLQQLPGLPQLPVLQLLLQRISGGNGLGGLHPAWIQFETNPAVHGLEWLAPLYQGIARQQVLRIDYQPFLEEPREIQLHPYLLKEWRNRWYIFGRNPEHRLWNLALDRIRSIEPVPDTPYLPNDLFDPDSWFADIIGVTKPDGAAPVDIEFETSPLVSFYFETKPLHVSQQLLRRDDSVARFRVRLIPNPELVSEFLRFGQDLRVTAPEAVVAMVAERMG